MKQESDLLKKRIYDRVLQMCVPVKVDGESRRKKIASENLQIMKTIIRTINSDTKLEMFNTKSNMQDYFELLFHSNGQRVLDEEVEASSCQKEN